jgi:formylglycine-generating enzyme required for sulfatase activity/tRNA A-37 threonylcarbamoyl transferase component Bud32
MSEARDRPGAERPDPDAAKRAEMITVQTSPGDAQATVTLSPTVSAGQPPAPARELPAEIAGYRRGRLLGSGGMAQVFEAKHATLDRVVALKLLKPQIADDADFALRFLRESHAMAAVAHPNVVAIYDAGDAGGLLYMALEYVPGGDLQRLLKRRGTIEVREALELIAGCARGLAAIHAAGLVHRDIKPQNIFLGRDGAPKIGDLGLARSADGADRMTMTGTSWGTPSYMAPEQIRGIGDIDIRCDIYALGATLFTLLTGVEPFVGPTSFVITHKVLSEPPPDPRSLNQLIPADVAALIAKAMAKDRDQRYATPEEFRQDLERARDGQRLLHAAAVKRAEADAPAPRAEAPPRKTTGAAKGLPFAGLDPLVLKTLALLVVGGLLAGVWWSMQGSVKTLRIAEAPGKAWPAAEGSDPGGRWAELRLGAVGARFRLCPAGTFLMGSPPDEAGREAHEVRHQVTIAKPFWMMSTECTQALYQEVAGANPSAFAGAQLPVDSVTWDEANAFCAALAKRVPGLTVRLPTEAEWEYACRAGATGAFDDGRAPEDQGWCASGALLAAWRDNPADEAESDARRVVAKQQGDPVLRTHPVGLLAPNAWGLFDLHGNVQEWCSDAWDGRAAYDELPVTDPEQTRGALSVARGGAWFLPPQRARSAARAGLVPKTARYDLGFRVVIAMP